MKLVSAPDTVKKFDEDYGNCTIKYGDLKRQLGEDMVSFISPVREKAEAIRNDAKYLKEVMEMGAEKARRSASVTIDLVRNAMGLNYWATGAKS